MHIPLTNAKKIFYLLTYAYTLYNVEILCYCIALWIRCLASLGYIMRFDLQLKLIYLTHGQLLPTLRATCEEARSVSPCVVLHIGLCSAI